MLWFVAALAFGQAGQSKSFYDQVVVRPDPSNGYEDHLRAADAVNDPAFFRVWQPQSESDSADYLQRQKAVVERYGKALEYIRIGDKKQARNPADPNRAVANMPQMTAFLNLPRLCSAEAYVRFADGRSSQAAQSLIDGLTFCRQIRTGTMLDYFVGQAGAEILFTRCAEMLPHLSEPDCRSLMAFADAQLAAPEPFVAILATWRASRMALIPNVLNLKPGQATGDSDQDPAISMISKLSPGERRDVANQVRDRVTAQFDLCLKRLQGPESQMMTPADQSGPPTISTAADLVDYLSAMMAPSLPAERILLDRTELRLLGLHARILGYKWRKGELPSNLREAVPQALVNDPATGTDFVYELRGEDSYRLYSRGFGEEGQVELGHQESRRRGGGMGIPPPSMHSLKRIEIQTASLP
ncbi:MAG TPA: hypothetical protein VG820_03915 [Fimbriimonadaceae bacterium]|nr:hypothetical protein [Fimbriimonadaceae bacterium]